jgi:hypothetical protein
LSPPRGTAVGRLLRMTGHEYILQAASLGGRKGPAGEIMGLLSGLILALLGGLLLALRTGLV